MMQYIVQDLMLLALQDERGSIVFSAKTSLPYGLMGAVVMELVLQGKLDTDKQGNLIVVDYTSTGDDFFDVCLNEIMAVQRPRNARFWVRYLTCKFRGFKQAVLNNLVELGVLEQQEQRVLWIFPTQRYSLADASAKQAVLNRVRTAVLNDAQLDSRTAALISLVKACKLTNQLFLPEERRAARQRVEAIARGEQVGQAVSDTVASVQAGINASVAAAIAASAASSSSSSSNS